MSDRGSFVTEFIYCPECFRAVEKILFDPESGLEPVVVRKGRIIAGYVKSMYPGGETTFFDIDCRRILEEAICHAVRVAVIPESGSAEVLIFEPGDAT